MSSSGSDLPTPDPLVQATQPFQAEVFGAAPMPSELVSNPSGLPAAQPGGSLAGYAPPPFVNHNTAAVQVNNVIAAPTIALSLQQHKTPFIVRAIWFVCIGWWLSGIVIVLSYMLFALVVTIPIGIGLIHRVPQIQTLRDRSREFQTHIVNGNVVIREGTITQRPFWQRAIWFVCVGLWLCAIWLVVAWAISLTVVLLPVSIMMIDRAPGLLTLQKH